MDLIIILILILGVMFFRDYIFVVIKNFHKILYYFPIDTFDYVKNKKWQLWDGFGIRMFCGYFGSGKSMLASKYVHDCYVKYKDSPTPLNILSNIPLSIPYTQLVNVQQLYDVEENTIIFIDECNTLFNARDWKNFPTEFVYQLCQNRKKHVMLLMTAPRFHLVDKSIRDVTQWVYQCRHPFWRFHFISIFDGWDFENCPNINMIRPLGRCGYFASNKWYSYYDSFAIIDNTIKAEFLSKEEILRNRQGSFDTSIIDEKHKSKRYRSREKK